MSDNASTTSGEKVGFIWLVAGLLRGPYRPNQYRTVFARIILRDVRDDEFHVSAEVVDVPTSS